MIRAFLLRWAEAAVKKQISDLEQQLDTAQRQLQVAQAECESLAAVIARDRARVEAEIAISHRRRADAEGANDESIDQSLRKFRA